MNNSWKRLIKVFGILGMMTITVPALADVTGNWAGALSTPNGAVNVSYTFAEDGTVLTGTTTGPDGASVAISDGKIEGEKISFSVSVDMQGTPATFTYIGVVKDDSIDLTIDVFGMPMSFTVTRTDA